ncbi:Hypothetical_protein [Hexamita inflata]|uniref:Hypothetical_protein n=1 Tax=Hexamita inflata TaxID=28002 RepID=A0ABP1JIK2_9EUKA
MTLEVKQQKIIKSQKQKQREKKITSLAELQQLGELADLLPELQLLLDEVCLLARRQVPVVSGELQHHRDLVLAELRVSDQEGLPGSLLAVFHLGDRDHVLGLVQFEAPVRDGTQRLGVPAHVGRRVGWFVPGLIWLQILVQEELLHLRYVHVQHEREVVPDRLVLLFQAARQVLLHVLFVCSVVLGSNVQYLQCCLYKLKLHS